MLEKNLKKWIGMMGLIVGSISFLINVGTVGAAETSSPLSYEVNPLLTEEQTQRGIDYFYLQVTPNEKKVIAFEIINNGDASSRFKVQFNRAATNRNGYLDYSIGNQKVSKELEVDFNELLTHRELEVEVPAKDKKTVTVDLAIPSKPFKGIVLGGFYVTKIETEDDSKKASEQEGIEIEQRLAYATAIMLQEEVPYTGVPNLKLNKISAEPIDNQAMLLFNFENSKPNILNKTAIKVDIYQAGKTEIYSTLEKENLNFAPNSLFDLGIPWDQKLMVPGEYNATVMVKSGENEWKFEKKFTISNEKSNLIEKEGDPLLQPQKQSLFIYILLGSSFLLIFILVFFLLKRK